MQEFMNITRALADENRVRAILCLRHGEMCVCQMIDMLKLAPSTVSKHLAILQQAGLVESRKKGRWRYFRVAGPKASRLARMGVCWVVKSLAEADNTVCDDKRLQAVMKKDIRRLCELYKA